MGFKEDIERDWGDPEIYGPWTKELEKDLPPLPPGEFRFYKSYYLITDNKPAVIDSFKPGTTESWDDGGCSTGLGGDQYDENN